MKKIISLILIVIFITACGTKKNEFFLKYHDREIKLDTVFNEEIHGEYNDYFESENCAFGDKDVTYMYDNIEIETYGNNNGELIIYSIRLIDAEVKTNEGIGIDDSINDAIEKYGDDYIKEDGKYTYEHGKTSLIFITDNGIIESIEYTLNNL